MISGECSDSQKVMLAFSEEIGRHVLVFFAGVSGERVEGKMSGRAEEESLARIANLRHVEDLIGAANYFGPLFGGAHTRVNIDHELVAGCAELEGEETEGEEAQREPRPIFRWHVDRLRAAEPNQLAAEFYQVDKPKRSQVDHAKRAIELAPLDLSGLNENIRRNSKGGIGVIDGPFCETLWDWRQYGALLGSVFRYELACLGNGCAGELQNEVEGGSFQLRAELPKPSHYGWLLHRGATSGMFVSKRESYYVRELPEKYVVAATFSWYPAKGMAQGVTQDEVEGLVDLHMIGVREKLIQGELCKVSENAFSIIYGKFASAVDKGRIGVCGHRRCQKIYLGKRKDSRYCSSSCKANASIGRRGEGGRGQ